MIQYQSLINLLNACLKRYILSDLLKVSNVGEDLTSLGSPFHSLGAAILKDWSANVFLSVLCSCNHLYMSLEQRPGLFCQCKTIISLRYCGASPLRHLKVSVAILCCILCQTGHQCRWYIALLGLSILPLPRISFVAIFWIRWNLSSSQSRRPMNNALP